jgi:hypothetical protein
MVLIRQIMKPPWHPDRPARNSVDGGRSICLLDQGRLKALKAKVLRRILTLLLTRQRTSKEEIELNEPGDHTTSVLLRKLLAEVNGTCAELH